MTGSSGVARGTVPLVLLLLSTAAPASAQDARLPDPLFPAVLERFEAGQPAEALAMLERDPASGKLEGDLLRARLLAKAGRHAASAALWDKVASREPLVADLAQLNGTAALAAAGDLERASERLSPSQTLSADQLDLLLELAARYLRAQRADRATELSRRVVDAGRRGARADRAYVVLAEALEAAGDREEAIQVWRAAQREFTAPEAFERARREEDRLARALGREPAPFQAADYADLARRLRQVSGFSAAIEMLERQQALEPDGDQRLEIEATIVENLFDLRANVEALRRALALIERDPPGELLPAMHLMVFRLDVREGRTNESRARGLALWNGRVPRVTRDQRRLAGRLLAAYLVSVGEVQEGATLFEDLAGNAPSRAEAIDALWRLGVAAVRLEDLASARDTFRRLLRLRPGEEIERLAQYWLAHVEDQGGDRAGARNRWARLAQRDPYHYYGIQAARRLGRAPSLAGAVGGGSATVPSSPETPLLERVRSHPDYQLAAVLARAGLKVEAAQAARRLAERTRDRGAALLSARASAAAGDHGAALASAVAHYGSDLQRPRSDAPADLWQLAYPLAYERDVRAAAARFGVDALLLYSLARQESRFDPQARSPVGALGLFQIMPATAARVAPQAGLDQPDALALMQPPVAATLAAKIVSDLSKLLGDEAAPMIAAYNAGEDRVGVWWEAASGLAHDLFIDTMPYSETRRYVREVLTNHFIYRSLYRPEAVERAR